MFKAVEECHICGQKDSDKDVRVRDPCHITGKPSSGLSFETVC